MVDGWAVRSLSRQAYSRSHHHGSCLVVGGRSRRTLDIVIVVADIVKRSCRSDRNTRHQPGLRLGCRGVQAGCIVAETDSMTEGPSSQCHRSAVGPFALVVEI